MASPKKTAMTITKRSPRPLPPPVAPEKSEPKSAEPEKPGGFLNGLFSSPNPNPTIQSGTPSSAGSNGSSAESPLSEEAERILASIPDHVGPEPGEAAAAGAPAADSSAEGDALLEMVGEEIVDQDDVAELLKMVGDSLAKWRKRQEYEKAGVRASSIAAKPWAQVINHLWVAYAPSLLADLTANVPGLAKALLMSAIAFGPAVAADMKQTKAERATRNRPADRSQAEPPADPGPLTTILRPARTTGGVRES